MKTCQGCGYYHPGFLQCQEQEADVIQSHIRVIEQMPVTPTPADYERLRYAALNGLLITRELILQVQEMEKELQVLRSRRRSG